ncbi:DUF1385 domain-containing protein [Candidatus Woesearchaeota archaeon]|nr:DUF1385 domain-containing protein [Candidatus Woesearchaeota archaeon]
MVKYYVGGQALIEGVMMKYKDRIAIAVREKNGKITVKKENIKYKDSNIPFIRGVVNLFIILYIGIKSLNYSANVAAGKEENVSTVGLLFSLLFAIIFAVALFKFLPLLFVYILDKSFHFNNILFNVLDGLFKILLFVLYVYAISFMKDVHRVFQYHGAEHKAVACHEYNKKLSVEHVQKFEKEHIRCGTSFIFLVLFISIIVYTFIPKDYSFSLKLLLRILLLPVVASLSYEALRLGARYKAFKFFSYPGLWIQKITTKNPTGKQVEVAIKALKTVLSR